MENNQPVEKNSQDALRRQAKGGRPALLLILILSVVNLGALILDADMYFLFSAAVPYYLVFIGKGLENGFVNGPWNVNGVLTYTGLVIAVVILAVYLLCWLLSKKRTGWLLAALVLFVLDTLALAAISMYLYDSLTVTLRDFLFHALLIWQMAAACHAGSKLKKQEEELAKTQGPRGTTPDLD